MASKTSMESDQVRIGHCESVNFYMTTVIEATNHTLWCNKSMMETLIYRFNLPFDKEIGR